MLRFSKKNRKIERIKKIKKSKSKNSDFRIFSFFFIFEFLDFLKIATPQSTLNTFLFKVCIWGQRNWKSRKQNPRHKWDESRLIHRSV